MLFGSILEALPVDIHRCVDHFCMLSGSILEALPVEIHGFLDHFGMIFGSLLEALAVEIHRFFESFWDAFWINFGGSRGAYPSIAPAVRLHSAAARPNAPV